MTICSVCKKPIKGATQTFLGKTGCKECADKYFSDMLDYECRETDKLETKPDMTNWDNPPKQERQYKELDKTRLM